jgi:hypothetical protein
MLRTPQYLCDALATKIGEICGLKAAWDFKRIPDTVAPFELAWIIVDAD